MCISPIHISRRNKVTPNRITNDGEILAIADMFGIDVPCGHCEQCLQSKRDSYLIRCLAEYNRSSSVVFATLTYDNRHLPNIYQYSQPVISPDGEFLAPPKRYKRSVWDKTHVQNFFKRLNEKLLYYIGTKQGIQRLVQHGGNRYISSEWQQFLHSTPRPIKYLLVCERGKNNIYQTKSGQRRGSRRPHYHAIIFCNSPLVDLSTLLGFIKANWTYGLSYNLNVTSRKGDGFARDMMQSLQYVCKYVTKDLTDNANHLLYGNHDLFLRHAPFNLISHGLGDNLLDNYDDNVLKQKLCNGITIPGTEYTLPRNIPIPRYNLLKSKCYETLIDGKYISTRYAEPEVFSDGFQPIFIDNEDEFEHRVYTKQYTLLTDFGHEVQQIKKQNSANEFKRLLQEVQGDNQLFTSLAHHSLSIIDTKYLDAINLVNPTEFVLYCLNPYKSHDGDFSDINFLAYLGIRQYKITKQRIQYIEQKISYETRLETSLTNKFELLCLEPL